jgi:transketolase
MLVLRPTDAAGTTVSWKLALENFDGPTALLLSRQVMADIPAKPGSPSRFADAMAGVTLGAYTIVDCDNPGLILIANGAEVILCVGAAEGLKRDHGIGVRVISAVSEGLFREQSEEYREELIPFGAPVLAFTAGLPINFAEMVGPLGKVVGLERFGASAPFKVLEEKFGYTVDAVVKRALDYVEDYKMKLSRVKSL